MSAHINNTLLPPPQELLIVTMKICPPVGEIIGVSLGYSFLIEFSITLLVVGCFFSCGCVQSADGSLAGVFRNPELHLVELEERIRALEEGGTSGGKVGVAEAGEAGDGKEPKEGKAPGSKAGVEEAGSKAGVVGGREGKL